MKLFRKKLDLSIFSDTYSEISIGRLYIHMFHDLFSSTVINNLVVDSDQFIQKLRDDGFLVEILASYHIQNFPTSEGSLTHDLNPVFYYEKENEYFINVEPKILLSIRTESFRVCYGNGTGEFVERIIEIYTNLNQKKDELK